MTARFVAAWGSVSPTIVRQLVDEPQVLGGEVERERDRRRLRLEERRSLVADVRCPDRAGGQDVVGGGTVDAGRFGQDESLREGLVEAEDDRVHGQLHGRPAAEWSEVEAASRRCASRTGRGPLEVGGLAPDHERQLAALGQADAAGHGGVEDAGAARPDRRFVTTERGRRHGRAVDEDRSGTGARG